MLTESCVACGAAVPLSAAVHVLVNPKGDEGVLDGYICGSCYEDHVEPLLLVGEDDEDRWTVEGDDPTAEGA